ncbi:MAG: endonuclease domain-containing protein [Bacteroidales bacterium]
MKRTFKKNMMEAEIVLWEVLKEKKLSGRKFRRQHSIGYYIADSCPFGRQVYCSSEKLIIELDGQHHYSEEGIAKDIERDAHLELMDKKVLRFENKDVLNNLTKVLKIIKSEFNYK